MALQADEEHLKEAYGHFKTEAQNLTADYKPKTVNIDGWQATRLAWQSLFSTIIIIVCFLHAFIKIRECCKRMSDDGRVSGPWLGVAAQFPTILSTLESCYQA